jgi:hypothetical protein
LFFSNYYFYCWFFSFLFDSNMGISELCTQHASTGASWWYLTMTFDLLVLQCVLYKTNPWDEENLISIFQFLRFDFIELLNVWLIIIDIAFLLFISVILFWKDNPSEKDINQGTLVVFNLDPSVSNDDLRQIFGAYGEVKEVIYNYLISINLRCIFFSLT